MLMITPSNFRADPLGWLGNQSGHFLLCVGFAYWFCVIGFAINGELPHRWVVFGLAAALYLAIEAPQGGTLADTLEDIMVVLIYGGGLSIWSFAEVARGTADVTTNLVEIMPLAAMMTVHFGTGAGIRWWQMRKAEAAK